MSPYNPVLIPVRCLGVLQCGEGREAAWARKACAILGCRESLWEDKSSLSCQDSHPFLLEGVQVLPQLTHPCPLSPAVGNGGINEIKRGHCEVTTRISFPITFSLCGLGWTPGRAIFVRSLLPGLGAGRAILLGCRVSGLRKLKTPFPLPHTCPSQKGL